MADRRRAEIEEKKSRLAELKRARDERRAQLATQDTAVQVNTLFASLVHY